MKILFTTQYIKNNDYYDYFESNAKNIFKFGLKRKISFGLRFLKENIPFLEILEYPSKAQYIKKIKEGWDVVGFSFFVNDIPRILEMVEIARENRVKELWAGNYGALTPGIENYFDRIFIGYAEKTLGRFLGVKVKEIKHPVLPVFLELGPLGIEYKPFGVLFTTRGCPMKCEFCQTPLFAPKPEAIPLDSIEEVLLKYKRMGIEEVVILDENFGIIRRHAENVVELLNKYKFMWSVMTRADLLMSHLDDWNKKRIVSAFIGIESLNQNILDRIKKREAISMIKNCIEELHSKNIYIIGYYMIGFPEETVDSILQDINELKEFQVDYMQVTILTPLPQTPLWHELDSKYGIFEKDFSKFDTKHLVWYHPNLTPDKARILLFHGFKTLNSPLNYLRSIKRLSQRYLALKESKKRGFRYLLFDPLWVTLKFKRN